MDGRGFLLTRSHLGVGIGAWFCHVDAQKGQDVVEYARGARQTLSEPMLVDAKRDVLLLGMRFSLYYVLGLVCCWQAGHVTMLCPFGVLIGSSGAASRLPAF